MNPILNPRKICALGIAVLLVLIASSRSADAFGIVARSMVEFYGGSVLDSFDSSDPLFSTNGLYTAERRKDGGDIITYKYFASAPFIPVVQLGNSRVYGRVKAPSLADVSLGAMGVVGSVAWHQGGNFGVEPGWVSPDGQDIVPAVVFPCSSGPTPQPGEVVIAQQDGTNTVYATNFYDNVLYSGEYYAASLAGNTIVLGDTRLILPSGLQVGTNDTLVILPGARLQVFAGGSTSSLIVSRVLNQTERAENLGIFFSNSVHTVQLTGNGTFFGIIVAPQAQVVLAGSPLFPRTHIDFMGSIWAASVGLNRADVHFDEALKQSPVFPPVITRGPHSTNVLAGGNAVFDVEAMGVDLRYQWAKVNFLTNGAEVVVNLPGETNTSLTLTNVDQDDGGPYLVFVSNPAGLQVSNVVYFGVDYPPFIIQQPAGRTVLKGSNVWLYTQAGGTYMQIGPTRLRFQWWRDSTKLPGATNFFFDLPDIQTNQSGLYTVVITNLAGSITSAPAAVLVFESAVATLQSPSAMTSGQFGMTLTGVPTFRYVIEASTNLIDWAAVATNQSPFNFIDTDLEAHPQRFYRAVYQP